MARVGSPPMAIREVLAEINERSTGWLRVSFFDATGAAVAPDSVTYRIDDYPSGTSIRAETSLTPFSSVEIRLTPDDMRIFDSSRESEEREVTVRASFGAGDECNARAIINVRNLAFLS